MPTYHIWTIGCQMNRAESDRLAGRFTEQGYTPTSDIATADFVVLNGCVVRASAESRVVNKLHLLRRLKKTRPDMQLAVTGCFVSDDIPQLKKLYPHVDWFFKAGEFPPWCENEEDIAIPPEITPAAYVPISQGCNNFCTYCIVPYRRGREWSRPVQAIVDEVCALARRGTREVTLLGQNVDSYGRDLPGQPDLADLLAEVNEIPELARIRFLTNHPKDLSDRLIAAVARLDKVCEQIGLPVQAGSDSVLKAMGRGYTIAEYLVLVNRIRAGIPGVALSTDVIVGFPGETAADFQGTLDLLSTVNFDTVHVAAYSPREGTVAAREMADDVPLAEKKERLAVIERLQEEIQARINAGLLNTGVEVLVEGRKKGKWFGRTRTDKLVFFNGKKDYFGQLVDILVEKTSPWSLQGKVNEGNRYQEEQ